MLVTLIRKKSIHKIVLPKNPIGNYWISDTSGEKEKKLVNIEGKSENWQIMSNNYVRIINPKYVNITKNGIQVKQGTENVIDKMILKEYGMCVISLGNTNELCILYCSPVYENNFIHLDIKNTKEIYIGSNEENDIVYKNALVENTHARIFYDNNRWKIENFDSKFGVFVNQKLVYDDSQILFNGDVIFIIGLKIIIMGNSIFINNPKNNVTYRDRYLSLSKEKEEIKEIPEEQENEDNSELYTEEDYFSRAPRITNVIECETVKIDAPPHMQDKEEMPAILVLGSTLSMGLMMMISIVMAIDGRMSGTATTKDTVFSLLMAFAMLISMILFPILNVKYEKKRKKRYEERRQKKYKQYLEKKSAVISQIMNKQKRILYENYISAEQCIDIILNKSPRLWERKIENYDFLAVKLGIGEVPVNINIQYPDEQFAMEDDNLIEFLNEIANNSKSIKKAPIAVSLVQKEISSIIIQNKEVFEKFMQDIMIQLITFHSYEDLKLVFLLKKENEQYWEYVKMLPHVWNNEKDMRFYANDYDDMKEISKYLEEELRDRQRYERENIDYRAFTPYYLIITDDYKMVENLKIITEILKAQVNLGFSLLCITEDITQLPNECKAFINIDNKIATFFENEISSNNQKQITLNTSTTFFFEKICKTIANIPIKYSKRGTMLLPNTYTFLEMYDVRINRTTKRIRKMEKK